jgi:hypothetical protein
VQTGTLNEYVAGTTTSKPPTTFKAGLSKGSIAVNFTGSALTWVVRAPKSALSQASANSNTPRCASIAPVAECRGYADGLMKVRMGYNNPNTFNQQFAVGALNQFTSGKSDRGQPSQFFPGLNKSVFEVVLANEAEVTSWSVNGSSAGIAASLPTCAGQCSDTPTGTITGNLDEIARALSQVMNRAAELLASSKARSRAEAKRNRNDAERSKRKAVEYETLANTLTIQFPAVVKTCPQAPPYCVTVDRQGTIDALRGLYANQRNSTIRTVARSYWRNINKTKRNDSLVRQAKSLEQQGLAELAKLPRFAVECK